MSNTAFDEDVRRHGGYCYTQTNLLSCRFAHQKTIDLITGTGMLQGRSVIDVGCGDGFFTDLIYRSGHPHSILGVDIAAEAIVRARERTAPLQSNRIRFEVGDAHKLPYADDSFEVALFNGMLHHLEDPFTAIEEGLRLAPYVVIFEPNGNNPGLKLIEKLSPYHLSHREKSYTYGCLRSWIEQAGGRVLKMTRAGFVPYFWPDSAASVMKFLEPLVEKVPVLNVFGPAYCVISIARQATFPPNCH